MKMTPLRHLLAVNCRFCLAAACAGLLLVSPNRASSKELFRPAIAVTPEGLTCVLGGGLDGKLVDSKSITPLMTHKQEYSLTTLKGVTDVAVSIGRPQESVNGEGDCEGMFQQELTLGPKQLGDYLVAVLGDRKEVSSFSPSKIEQLPNTGEEFLKIVDEYLRETGLEDPKVVIKQVLRSDLDGDGETELLINAINTERELMRKGEYSVVLLHKKIDGETQTFEIASEITMEDSDELSALWENTIAGLLDLDGDGEMEIVLYGAFYLGDGWQVIHLQDGQVAETLTCGCGG